MDYEFMWNNLKNYLISKNEKELLVYMCEEELLQYFDNSKVERGEKNVG